MAMGSALARPLVRASQGRARASTAPFSSVMVHRSVGEAEAAWAALEAISPISGYQTRKWLIPWIETVGRALKLELMIVTALAPSGDPVALLPLYIVRSRGLAKACFLGKRDVNFNLGLFAPGHVWSARHLGSLLREAARSCGGSVHLFELCNLPEQWRGAVNPLSRLPHTPSPSYSASGRLVPDAEAFFAERSSRATRKTLAKKERRLAKTFGPLRHVVARDLAMAHAILADFETQKSRRLEASGLPDLFSDASLMEFLKRAGTQSLPEAAIELHALYAGERIVATFGGVGHDRRFSGMFISFDDHIEVARSSPGDQLLRRIVTAKCQEGYEIFDLGIGEALYKTGYCNEIEPLVDVAFAVTAIGHVWALASLLKSQAKRTIKQTPQLWAFVRRLRQLRRNFAR